MNAFFCPDLYTLSGKLSWPNSISECISVPLKRNFDFQFRVSCSMVSALTFLSPYLFLYSVSECLGMMVGWILVTRILASTQHFLGLFKAFIWLPLICIVDIANLRLVAIFANLVSISAHCIGFADSAVDMGCMLQCMHTKSARVRANVTNP